MLHWQRRKASRRLPYTSRFRCPVPAAVDRRQLLLLRKFNALVALILLLLLTLHPVRRYHLHISRYQRSTSRPVDSRSRQRRNNFPRSVLDRKTRSPYPIDLWRFLAICVVADLRRGCHCTPANRVRELWHRDDRRCLHVHRFLRHDLGSFRLGCHRRDLPSPHQSEASVTRNGRKLAW